MRTTTAYFAGAGTVVTAVVAGLGGGILISNIVSPHAPKIEMSKLELRMSEKPIPATIVSSEPAKNETSAPPQPAAPVTQAATSDRTNSEQAKAPEVAFAKARDNELKPRDAADVKSRDVDARREARRAAEEKRKAERRQLWTERRRPRQDQELREVEERVREETEQPRQVFAAEPARLETPRIRLFDLD